MRRITLIMFVLLLTCQFILAGAGVGNVLCVGDDGHVAVESRHGVCEISERESSIAPKQDACTPDSPARALLLASDCTDVDLSLLSQRPMMRDQLDHDDIVAVPEAGWPAVLDASFLASADASADSPCWQMHVTQAAPARQASHRAAILSTVLRI